MTCIDLTAIDGLGCDSNAPGAVKLYLIKKEKVTAIPGPGAGTHTISTNLTLVALAIWAEWVFTTGTLTLTDDLEGEVDAQSWKTMAVFQVSPGQNSAGGQIDQGCFEMGGSQIKGHTGKNRRLGKKINQRSIL